MRRRQHAQPEIAPAPSSEPAHLACGSMAESRPRPRERHAGRSITALGGALLLATAATYLFTTVDLAPLAWLGLGGYLGGAALSWWAAASGRPRPLGAGTLIAEGSRLRIRIGDREEGPALRCHGGWFDGRVLRLELEGGRVLDAEGTSASDARALWRALQLHRTAFVRTLLDGSPRQRFARTLLFPAVLLGVTVGALGVLALGAMLAFGAHAALARSSPALAGVAAGLMGLAMAVVVGWGYLHILRAAAGALLDTRLTVGRDGIRLSSLGRGGRFIRHEDMSALAQSGNALTIVSHHRPPVTFHAESSAEAWSVIGSVEEMRKASVVREGAGDDEVQAAALVARAGRGVDDWLQQLRALAGGSGGAYRASALDVDALARCVDDVRAEPEVRIGAAVTLAATGRPELVERVRISARGCADEDVRAALEESAEGEAAAATVRRVVRAR